MRAKVVFAGLMVLKGLGYSLNNPCKEILYQPTSAPVKFKSKVRRENSKLCGCAKVGPYFVVLSLNVHSPYRS